MIGTGNTQNNYAAFEPLDLGLIGRSSPRAAANRIKQMPIDDALKIVAAASAEDAAAVLGMLLNSDDDFSVALVSEMHPGLAAALLDEGGPALAALRDVPVAAEAICRCHDERKILGLESDIVRRAASSPRGTAGFYRVFAEGVVHWSKQTGAQATYEPFSSFHRDNGGTGGRLGFPLAEAEVVSAAGRPAGEATRQDFESESADPAGHASVYWTEEHGMFATWGGIGWHYQRRGGADRFGFPVGPEVAAGPSRRPGDGDSGWIQPFEKASIVFTDAVGAIEIWSPIREHFDALDGVTGRLGFPRGKSHAAGRSPQGTEGRFQRFEGAWDYPEDLVAACIGFDRPGGATIYTSVHGTYKVDGGIGILYERMGGTPGWLGFPTEDSHRPQNDSPTADNQRRVQTFEGGAIYWSPEHDAVAVRGDVLALLHPEPPVNFFAQLHLGFPTHPEQPIADGPDMIQFFEHGLITRRADGIKVWQTVAGSHGSQPPAP
ncbi:hypothetical protein OWR29_17260 [Actinoplanes sp. Pm04-4]|uniref:LGFP repeat-containing protein n=1 Tax=Paractinoplanes pyxinae TaxID=2997416 RepID=A0ABT4B108_9ACTN|nr:hypothetical protein [Actinoplanes pyxinae]MCY1139752.1 hypothetical protein [Actinoplanes pyxinae]